MLLRPGLRSAPNPTGELRALPQTRPQLDLGAASRQRTEGNGKGSEGEGGVEGRREEEGEEGGERKAGG